MSARRLIDPSDDQLLEALASVTEEADYRAARPLERDVSSWRAFLAESAGLPEGVRAWIADPGEEAGAVVKAAWWTDHPGRRHWVLWSCVSTDEEAYHSPCPWEPEDRGLPPFWYVCPERVFCRRLGPRPAGQAPRWEWVAYCGCGVAGAPEALAWAGDRCGPCHDAQEERLAAGLPAGVVRPLVFRWSVRGPGGLAFSPDGRWLAVNRDGGVVLLQEVGTGSERVLAPHRPDTAQGPVAFSPDGRFLACANRLLGEDRARLTLHDAETGQVIHAAEVEGPALAGGFLPGALRLPLTRAGALEVWQEAGKGWQLIRREEGEPGASFPALGGSRLAFLEGSSIQVVDLETGQRSLLRELDERDFLEGLALSADGRTLALTTTGGEKSGYYTEVWDLAARERVGGWVGGTHERHWEYRMGVCGSHERDGAFVVTLETNEGALRFWEAGTSRELGALALFPESPAQDWPGALLFSADGRWLASESNSADVVKLWPWRDLLGLGG
jgi:hypothetical protein